MFTCLMNMTIYTVKTITTLGSIVSYVYGTNISTMHIWYNNSLHEKHSIYMYHSCLIYKMYIWRSMTGFTLKPFP
jgi:hypothetical protein